MSDYLDDVPRGKQHLITPMKAAERALLSARRENADRLVIDTLESVVERYRALLPEVDFHNSDMPNVRDGAGPYAEPN